VVNSPLLSESEFTSSCAIIPSDYFGSSGPIRSPTQTEKSFQWVGPVADAGAAQNSGAVGSGAVAGSVISAAAVVGVVGALVVLLLLRTKQKTAVDVDGEQGQEQEDHDLGESFGTLAEWSDIISEGNGMLDDMDESLTADKPS
jgi:hypothetical protein